MTLADDGALFVGALVIINLIWALAWILVRRKGH